MDHGSLRAPSPTHTANSDEIGSQETVLGHAPISPGLSPPNVMEYLLPFLRKRTYRSSCSMGGQQERPRYATRSDVAGRDVAGL